MWMEGWHVEFEVHQELYCCSTAFVGHRFSAIPECNQIAACNCPQSCLRTLNEVHQLPNDDNMRATLGEDPES